MLCFEKEDMEQVLSCYINDRGLPRNNSVGSRDF